MELDAQVSSQRRFDLSSFQDRRLSGYHTLAHRNADTFAFHPSRPSSSASNTRRQGFYLPTQKRRVLSFTIPRCAPAPLHQKDYHLTIPLKLAGENEVKAQVKLRFKNASRERMIVTRNVSVTVKKTGLSMKTLEGILSKDEANEGNTKVGIVSGCPPACFVHSPMRALAEEHHLNQVLRDRQRGPKTPRRLAGYP